MNKLFIAVSFGFLAQSALERPAFAQSAAIAPIEATEISGSPFETGVIDEAKGGLPATIWAGSNPESLQVLLSELEPKFATPTLGRVFTRLLLSSTKGAEGLPASLGGLRLRKLAEAGFAEEVRTIASLSDASPTDPLVAEALAVADLLENKLSDACLRNKRLSAGKDAAFWVKLRVLCYAADDQFDAADLTLRILRERGGLSDAESMLLSAVSIPAPLDGPIAPRTAMHLAGLRLTETSPSFFNLDSANAGVLKSIAGDKSFPARTRLQAANKSAAMGLVSSARLREVYADLSADGTDPAAARKALAERPGDIMTGLAVFEAAEMMSAPEFLRDRATLVAGAINNAGTFSNAAAQAMLYEPDIKDFEGVIVGPEEAAAFAKAKMLNGDSKAASRWLLTMLGGGLGSLEDNAALEFIELMNLLALIDPVAAGGVSAAANASVEPPAPEATTGPEATFSRATLASVVGPTVGSMAGGAKGMAILGALVLSGNDFQSDPVSMVVADAAMDFAGLSREQRELAFERAWRGTFPSDTSDVFRGETVEVPQKSGLVPRLKPEGTP